MTRSSPHGPGIGASRGDLAKKLLASAFGLGLAPIAPGSFGALLGVGIHVLVVLCLSIGVGWWALLAAFMINNVAHFALTDWSVRYWRNPDPKNFVLDEVAGYLFVPIILLNRLTVPGIVAAFLLFRILDIIKVPPARQVDRRMHGPWGILLDDLISAVYAAGVIFILHKLGFSIRCHQLLFG
jgi:phosphatidylglycerophosphatase A